MMSYYFNYLEFISKNIFWYSLMTFFNKSFNPTEWWIYQFFWGGVLFVIFEMIILRSCVTETLIFDKDGD
jgi:hypothetical protein